MALLWQALLITLSALTTYSAGFAHAAELQAPVASKPSPQAVQRVPAASASTAASSGESAATQRAAERQQIDARRRSLDAEYLREQGACLHRFFVNDCLDHARRSHRAQAQVLDAQLNAIDLAGRQQRAEAERQRVAENLRNRPAPVASAAQKQAAREQEQQRKLSEHAARAASDAANQAAYASKQAAQEQAQGQAQKKGQVLMPQPAVPATPNLQPAPDVAAAQAAFAQKQADYQRRKAQAAQQFEQAKKSGSGPAPALPIPEGY